MTPLPDITQSFESSRRRQLFELAIVLGLSVVLAVVCYMAAGVSLGLFFGPVLLLAFFCPPWLSLQRSCLHLLLMSFAMTLGVGGVWLAVAQLSIFDAGRCSLILAAYILALAGCVSFFRFLKLPATFAAALTTVLGSAWLTWPIWLSPWLAGASGEKMAQALTAAHPLMALNTVLFDRFNIWDRYTLAYQQLTTLNQDVLYRLPQSVIWAVLFHGLIGGLGLAILTRYKRRDLLT